MAEDSEKGTSAWFRVPTWDGNPREWRSFKREMAWWMASLDKESCKKFNVAARWTLRQTGVVRARCEEFLPEELEATVGTYPPPEGDAAAEVDPFYGLRKLLDSLEQLNGTTELDRNRDLRAQFYQDLKRQPNERISTFCTRFRSLCGEMKREGIELPKEELGWFLRERLGLDPLRKQLLETALSGRESYGEVETECLRLFRDLHVSDPLHRKTLEQHSPLLGRFLGQTGSGSGSSYRSTVPSSSSSMHSGARSFKSTSSSLPSSKFKRPSTPMQQMRQSLVTEQDEFDDGEEELIPDGDADVESPNLEEVLQAEVEVLASELQQAEEEGVSPDMLEELEVGVEKAAESLVTMREARQKLNDLRKDRGFGKGTGKSSMPKGKPSGNQVTARKQDPQHPCWDCGQTGHWLGDPQCPKPGAGLHLPANKKKPKQVKIVEHHATDVTEVMPDRDGAVVLEEHEIQMAENAICGKTLKEALSFGSQGSHDVCVGGTPQLMQDKKLVGALDSACNRTCTGSTWLHGYLDALSSAPQCIQDLIQCVPEREVFRFGNGGTQESTRRWRLPMMVGKTLVCVWTSVVEVPSLGLLLGRDFFGWDRSSFEFLQTNAAS